MKIDMNEGRARLDFIAMDNAIRDELPKVWQALSSHLKPILDGLYSHLASHSETDPAP